MGCSNQKQTDLSVKQLKKQCFNLNKEITQLQRKILFTNVEYQFKYNRTIEKKVHSQETKNNFTDNSNTSNEDFAKEDLISKFYVQMKEFQKQAQNIFIKGETIMQKYNMKAVENQQFYLQIRQKLKLLHEFAFILVINSEMKNSKDQIMFLGSFCQSLVIA
ncbi:hypothetical protein TTHERM_00275880 (macronuclear) [Tetrahymena thermophila SB210]|uniref:Uncharacterized protein n=1 Tax=Tetrahymena thermophila (strain SB210) TaxID=312017 RepID=I7M7S9_TETTS|nr:hypothetical protein TTHERM_00275880 [Tetrahymena thermophila SB210]EAR95782.1 hypothetical protein TTHERM_00275880 [Tetrahymena thermophila SB210]|eukprot:XP_001016027.1 hypothetical protein TTHERM_00275880 [Tetrahymena thermophila SB210]